MDSLQVHDYSITAEAPEGALTTDELREQFVVESFMAPFVVVRRKSDGVRGTMEFTHSPRFYFDFAPL